MIPLKPVRTSPPNEAPIALADAKAHLNARTFADDDDLIAAAIDAATAHLDGYAGALGRCLVTQTWRQDFSCFPACGKIRLPLSPVQSVSAVTYRDAADAEQTLAASVYASGLDDALGPYIALKTGQAWPATFARDDAVSVVFVAGYGAASAVPGPIKSAIRLMVGDLYANRETKVSQNLITNPTVERLLAPYRRVGF